MSLQNWYAPAEPCGVIMQNIMTQVFIVQKVYEVSHRSTCQDTGGSRKYTHGETDGGTKQLEIMHSHRDLRGSPVPLPVCV